MVLEEASASADAFSDIDNGPSSDSRPSDWRYGYSYTMGQFAKPAPFTGFDSDYSKAKIDVHLALLSQLAQRRLTDREVDINARNVATGVSINSYAVLLGWAAATFQVYRKMNMLTLPFLDLEKRGFSFDRFGPLRGQTSRFAWQGVRVAVYGQSWAVLTGIAGFAWANAYAQLQLQTDPDLKDLVNVIKKRSWTDRQADKNAVIKTIPEQIPRALGQRPRKDRTSDTLREGESTDNSNEEKMLSDAQRTLLEREINANANRSQAGTVPSRTPTRSEHSEASYNDESSPTGGQGPFDYGGSTDNQTATNSAWDRVRQQASNNESDQPTGSQSQRQQSWQKLQNASGDENSSAFSGRGEDPQLERARAQKEFDAQLERERKGSADSEGSSKSW